MQNFSGWCNFPRSFPVVPMARICGTKVLVSELKLRDSALPSANGRSAFVSLSAGLRRGKVGTVGRR